MFSTFTSLVTRIASHFVFDYYRYDSSRSGREERVDYGHYGAALLSRRGRLFISNASRAEVGEIDVLKAEIVVLQHF